MTDLIFNHYKIKQKTREREREKGKTTKQ